MYKLASFAALGIAGVFALSQAAPASMDWFGGDGERLQAIEADKELLGEQCALFHEQVAASDVVCQNLIVGKCTLAEAVAEIEIINRGRYSMYGFLQTVHPEASHRELTARYAMNKALVMARRSPSPSADDVQARLEAQFREIFQGEAQ
ncbi:MAG TPA: hypothetical protein VGI99_10555 [Gemmataceae bacterium]|jgi:hypothetical protein